nr:protein EXECUTER 1, chloroplastic [Ipomoea batatas]
MDSRSPTENKNDLFGNSSEVSEDDEDSDDDSGFGNALQDLIPGVKVKVLKVTAPAKVDRDLISKVIEDIIDDEDEDEETDSEIESVGAEEEIKDKSDIEQNAIEIDADRGVGDGVEQNQIALKVVVSGLVQNMSSNARSKDFQRVPARLERKGRLSFTFTIEEDDKQTSGGSKQSPRNRSPKLQGQRSIDHLMLDLAKFIGRGKIPMKVGLAKLYHHVLICFFILMIIIDLSFMP